MVLKSKSRDDEDVVWTLYKGDRTAEARIGTVASSGGQPELRLCTRRRNRKRSS